MPLAWENMKLEANVEYGYHGMKKLLCLIEVAPAWKWHAEKGMVEIPTATPYYLFLKRKKNNVFVYLATPKKGPFGRTKLAKAPIAKLEFQSRAMIDIFATWYAKHYPEFWNDFIRGFKEELESLIELANRGVTFKLF